MNEGGGTWPEQNAVWEWMKKGIGMKGILKIRYLS